MVTVKDIREKEFTKQKHGYHEDEVDEFLDEIADQMEALIQENKALMQQAQEARAMADRAISEHMVAAPAPVQPIAPVPEAKPIHTTDEAYFRNLESTLRETLLSAQRIADETVSEAKKKAAAMVADAEDKVGAVMSQHKAEIEGVKVELEGVRKAAEDYRIRFKRLVREQLHAFKLDESVLEDDCAKSEDEV